MEIQAKNSMQHFLWIILMTAVTCGNAAAGEWYRWVDESGNVHYGDMPAPGAKRINRGPEQVDEDAGLSYEARRAKQKFPVTLYVTGNCGDICQQARDFLKKRGVPFAEKSLSSEEDFENFRQSSGDDNLPALTVGKTWLKGFQPQAWGGELDIAGYP